jgi:hypothetical protein
MSVPTSAQAWSAGAPAPGRKRRKELARHTGTGHSAGGGDGSGGGGGGGGGGVGAGASTVKKGREQSKAKRPRARDGRPKNRDYARCVVDNTRFFFISASSCRRVLACVSISACIWFVPNIPPPSPTSCTPSATIIEPPPKQPIHHTSTLTPPSPTRTRTKNNAHTDAPCPRLVADPDALRRRRRDTIPYHMPYYSLHCHPATELEPFTRVIDYLSYIVL